ncbi:unnamed protein product [Diabrotica balteata]|uniref:Saposin B-type domain-containing protein n=1 Tax=Diabrotica balteata TaxID=107213 RepID=A0A9N9XDB1_DIABA|nr:unnamed protein product [Diabrotica balteata]
MKTTLVLTLLFCVSLTVYAKTTHRPDHTTHHAPEPEEFECDSCITFATVIKNYVDERLPLAEVERDAETLCDVLPGHLGDYCEDELLPKVDRIYDLLHKESPQDVCDRLDFC